MSAQGDPTSAKLGWTCSSLFWELLILSLMRLPEAFSLLTFLGSLLGLVAVSPLQPNGGMHVYGLETPKGAH